MRFQFIEDHRDDYPVRRLCDALKVSPSGYYAWRNRPPSAREMANQELTEKIEAVFEESKETYGTPRNAPRWQRRLDALVRLRDAQRSD